MNSLLVGNFAPEQPSYSHFAAIDLRIALLITDILRPVCERFALQERKSLVNSQR